MNSKTPFNSSLNPDLQRKAAASRRSCRPVSSALNVMENWILIALSGGLFAANVAVSIAVGRSIYFSRTQKLAQCCLVWFIPLLGPLIVGVFLYAQRQSNVYDTRQVLDRNDRDALEMGHPSKGGHDI